MCSRSLALLGGIGFLLTSCGACEPKGRLEPTVVVSLTKDEESPAPVPTVVKHRPAIPDDARCKSKGQRFVRRPAASNEAAKVVRSDFCMGATEVTVSEYKTCVDGGACTPPEPPSPRGKFPGCNWGVAGRENHPVNCVTYAQASEFCRWAGARLPTWAEWHWVVVGEKARRFPWGDTPPSDQLCWSGVSTRNSTCEVASSRGDEVDGIYDLMGNVAEWTASPEYEPGYDGVILKYTVGTTWNFDIATLVGAGVENSVDVSRAWEGYGFRCVSGATSGTE